MVTTGSKLFFGIAAATLVAAVVYGVATELGGSIDDYFQGRFPWIALPPGIVNALLGSLTLGYKGGVGDHIGYGVLTGTAAAAAFLGLVVTGLRDADAEAVTEISGGKLGRLTRPSLLSFWPPLAAFGAASVVIGIAVSPALVILGLVVLGLVLVEWSVAAWAEAASASPEVNRLVRNRILAPLEVPIVATIIVGSVVLLMSRVLLAVSSLGAVIAATAVATMVLAVASLLASRPKLSRPLVAGVVVVAALALLAAGIVSAAVGTRHIAPHEEEGTEAGASEEGG